MGYFPPVIDLEGRRFGALTVMGRHGKRGRYISWKCVCDCGKEIIAVGRSLRSGRQVSCSGRGEWCSGKRSLPQLRRLATECGWMSERRSWWRMLDRCNNRENGSFADYGGRGIKVCERWKDFFQFLSDMGPKPEPSWSIERKDVNGNYEPGNCCWLLMREQNRNQRRSRYVEYRGERLLLIDLADRLGLNRSSLAGRVKMGWPIEVAVSAPIRPKAKNGKMRDGSLKSADNAVG